MQINPAGGLTKDEIDRIINEASEMQRVDISRRELRVMQNKLEGMIYTNDKVFKEFGKLLNEDDRNRVGKILVRAKEAAGEEDKQKINDAIFELQAAARILTSVMLYNPLKSSAPKEESAPSSMPSEK